MENIELVQNIINEALIDKWYDRYTGEEHISTPMYDVMNDIIHIYTPVKPYKLVVLRRLLYIAKIPYKNIIVGNPDV